MPTSTLARALWSILLAMFLVGCATSTQRLDDLDHTLRNYKKMIRWADFGSAYTFKKWEQGDQAAPPASLENVRVTRYEVGNTHLSTDKMTYTQTVRISYYLMDSARERQLMDHQKWVFDKEKGRWFLISDIPKF